MDRSKFELGAQIALPQNNVVGGGWWVVGRGWWVVGGAKFVLSLKTDFKSADDQTFFENFKFEKFCKIPYLCKQHIFLITQNLCFSNTSSE